MLTNVKLGKNMRSVSIVGIGATPFFNGVENETYKGLTNGELFGHAALDAMKDAGIEPRDVQYFFHGSANPHVLNNCITPNLQVADWFGMRGKGSLSHSEGCCTGYIGLEEAVFAVATGWKRNVVGSPDPFVYGSSDLADPETAATVLRELTSDLKPMVRTSEP